MSKRQWLMVFGMLTAVIPFAGFPSSLDTILFGAIGIITIVIAYSMPYSFNVKKDNDASMPFSDHKKDSAPGQSGLSYSTQPRDYKISESRSETGN